MKRIIAIILSILFLAIIIYNVKIVSILSSLKNIDIYTFAVSLVLIGINLLVVALRLQRILIHFGRKIPFFVSFHASLSGMVAGLFLINVVGAVLGRQVVLRALGISAALSTFVSGYERLILAVIGGVMATFGGLTLAGSHVLNDLFDGLPIVPIVVSLALVGIGVILTSRSSFEKETLRRLRHPRRLLEVLEVFLISAISQIINIYIYTVILSSMDFHLVFWQVMAASAMVSFAASVPISVNGWGVREIAAIYAFGLLGVDASSAAALSIAVGLLNTFVVLIAAPAFVLTRRVFVGRIKRYQTASHGSREAGFSQIQSQDQLDFQKISSFSLGICVSVLLFFQFPVNVSGTILTLNFGDIFALLGLGLIASQTSFSGLLNFRLSHQVLLWLVLVSVAIYLSLAIGAFRYGAIPWAIGNRGLGWLVLLGYFGSGALFVGQFGRQGARRLAEILLLTGATVAVVHLTHRIAYTLDWTALPPPPNFEGFSANRNAFAFQLLVTLGLAACYILPTKVIDWRKVGPAMAMLVFATVATNSLTSYVCLICLVIIFANARRDLLVKSFFVVFSGLIFYACLPLAVGAVRFVPYYANLSWLWFEHLLHHSWSWLDENVAKQIWQQSIDIHDVRKLAPAFDAPSSPALTPPPAGMADDFKDVVQQLPTRRLTGYGDSSVAERLESLRGGLRLWFAHPIFGSGLGAFISTQISKTGTPLVIHSTFVWIIAEMGLLGLLLTGWIPVMQIRRLWTSWWYPPKHLIGGFTRNDSAIFLLVATFCIFSLAHEIAYQRIFWFVLGALLAKPGYTSVKAIFPVTLRPVLWLQHQLGRPRSSQ